MVVMTDQSIMNASPLAINNTASLANVSSMTAIPLATNFSTERIIDYFMRRDHVEDKLVQIVFCIVYTTIFALGLTGNTLVCYVVFRNRAMHTVTNLFITNLALSDILLCTLAVPFTPLYTFTGTFSFIHFFCFVLNYNYTQSISIILVDCLFTRSAFF